MASTIVIITGMHRSGTSLVTSILHMAGLDVGRNLLGKTEANPHGHYEDLDFSNLQDSFLTNRGYNYLRVPSADIELSRDEVIQSRNLISQREQSDSWGFKDPRTCLFLNHWFRLIPDAKYLFVFRHPLEVFISLLKRAEYYILKHPLEGFEAWYQYNKRVLAFFETHRPVCTLCHVRAIIQSPEEFFKIIKAKFNLTKKIEFQQLFDPAAFSTITIPEWCREILNERFPKQTALYNEMSDMADLPIDSQENNTNTNEDILDALKTMIQSMTAKHRSLHDELKATQNELHQTREKYHNLKNSIPGKIAKFITSKL